MTESPFRLFIRVTAKEGEYDPLLDAFARIAHVASEIDQCAQYEVFGNDDARSVIAIETFRDANGLATLISRIADMRVQLLSHSMHGAVTTIGDPGQSIVTGAKEAGWDVFNVGVPLAGHDALAQAPAGTADVQAIVMGRMTDHDAFIDAAEAMSAAVGEQPGCVYHRFTILDASHACLVNAWAPTDGLLAFRETERFKTLMRDLRQTLDIQELCVSGTTTPEERAFYDTLDAIYYEPTVGFSRLNILG